MKVITAKFAIEQIRLVCLALLTHVVADDSLHLLQEISETCVDLALNDIASKNQKQNVEVCWLVVPKLD